MRKQFVKTMLEVGSDPDLVVLIGDISHFALREFAEKYPNRFYNMGIAEQAMMSMASGLALNGFYPVVHSITPFVTERCFEQIKDDLCYQGAGVNIISVGSAFDYASLGSTHHSYGDIAILRSLPNMQIIYPAAPHEFDLLFRETYRNGQPTYFRLPAAKHNLKTTPKFGEAEKMRDGSDVTIVATGPQLQNAWDAAGELFKEGIGVEIIYLSTIKPISINSQKMIKQSLIKTGRLITIEEHSVIGGAGDEVVIVAGNVKFEHIRMGIRDKFLTNYGSYSEHCAANGLTREGVIDKIRAIMNHK